MATPLRRSSIIFWKRHQRRSVSRKIATAARVVGTSPSLLLGVSWFFSVSLARWVLAAMRRAIVLPTSGSFTSASPMVLDWIPR